jgi:hypothetical protein
MKRIGYFGLVSTNKARALAAEAVKNATKEKGIVDELGAQSLDRAKAQADGWRKALEEWEDERFPDRYSIIALTGE